MGERFGNYEILRRLASGGMAEVFLAKQVGLGGFERLVCIKRILPHLSEEDDFIQMFQDEARIAANLIHPNIAQIYDIGHAEDAYYIAMEYVRGEDLRKIYNQEVQRGRPIPPEPAAQIIMGAAEGLDYAHRQTSIDGRPLGIVHRDISPQNILTTYDGHVKLVDFGVAKAANKMTETRSGVLKGKYSYMSPEQASGNPIDARTDIFALGITLYEVTTGTRLFKRDNEIDTLHAVIACDVTPPGQVVPGYDEELEGIIMRTLAHEPDDRYATAGELAQDLEQFLIRRNHPTGAGNLGAYMQDLFAEKLADELLFGAQPWEENPTPNGPRGTRRKSGHSSSESRRSSQQAAKSPPKSAASANAEPASEADKGRDRTVIEEAPSRTEALTAKSQSQSSRSGWGSGSAVSQTKTHQAQTEAAAAPAPASPAPRRRLPPQLLIGAATLLVIAVLSLAIALSGGGEPRQPLSGSLVVDSEPRGARVKFLGEGAQTLNKKYSGHRTVFTITEGVPVGSALRARFSKDGYDVVEKRLPPLAEGVVPEPLFAKLPSNEPGSEPASLILLSSPPGASVAIDGEPIEGETPLTDIRVAGGTSHEIEFRLAGHAPIEKTISLEPGARRFIEAELTEQSDGGPQNQDRNAEVTKQTTDAGESSSPAASSKTTAKAAAKPSKPTSGRLTVEAPRAMRVRIGRRALGETPIKNAKVPAGVHVLRVRDPARGFTKTQRLRIRAGREHNIRIAPEKGNLALNAIPWAWVRLGNGSRQETPVRLSVLAGQYSVEFECPDGSKKRQKAKVRPGKTAALSVNCR